MMTVAELIAVLSELPQHHLVIVPEYDEDGDLCSRRDPQPTQYTTYDGPGVIL